MSKKIIVSIPDNYNTDHVVLRIKREFNDDEKIAVAPVHYLTEIVPEIVEAILKTKGSDNE